MSIIFGISKASGELVTQEELMRLASATTAYTSDGVVTRVKGNVGVGIQPFLTSQPAEREQQPILGTHESMLVFDGRLDNRTELLDALGVADSNITDPRLILTAFEKWGECSFARLVGDWALALSVPASRTLYLARDHAGTRSLFYQLGRDSLIWSTYLETFFAEGREHALDDAYVARYLSGAPLTDLTPYRGICAVPSAHFLAIQGDRVRTSEFWSPLKDGEVHYGRDEEYESHFLTLFGRAVERRSAIGDPVIAQLSGGMDSTSITCMSDEIRRAQGGGTAEFLETISYLCQTEPNWNEGPFVAATEARRGKVGIHLDVPSSDALFEPLDTGDDYLLPGVSNASVEFEQRLQRAMNGRGHRAILSGIGGDELLGGVPTPAPELANYLVQLDFSRLFKQGLAWSIANRNPLLHLLGGTAKYTARLYLSDEIRNRMAPSWIAPRLRSLCGRPSSLRDPFRRRMRMQPSALSNARTWVSTLETLPHLYPVSGTRYEYRYPFLDRDLVDFLLRVPREQITRPGRRRSLMRRALRSILPLEVLERKRKAYVSRGPLLAMRRASERLAEALRSSAMAEYGYVEPEAMRESLNRVVRGQGETEWPLLMKSILFELWLRMRSSQHPLSLLPTSISFELSEPTDSAHGSILQSL